MNHAIHAWRNTHNFWRKKLFETFIQNPNPSFIHAHALWVGVQLGIATLEAMRKGFRKLISHNPVMPIIVSNPKEIN